MYYKSKYSNHKVHIDGEQFDSKKEASRYQHLLLLQKAGEIKNLQRQVKFVLIPTQKDGKRVAESECSYFADFVYQNAKTGKLVVEDSKGMRTKDYIIKRKLMRWVYGIKIMET